MKFLEMTDEQVGFIIKDLYSTDANEKIVSIKRKQKSIEVRLEAYIYENGAYEILPESDLFVLKSDGIDIYGSMVLMPNVYVRNNWLYQKYLYAIGLHDLGQNNKYLQMIE